VLFEPSMQHETGLCAPCVFCVMQFNRRGGVVEN
jgi:hypothetical protein